MRPEIDFPVAPLLDEVRRRNPLATGTVALLARTCGVSGTTAHRWLDHGLTVWEADRATVRLGLHPSAIWGCLWPAVFMLDDLVEREHVRLERWVRAWVARHRFDPCSPRRPRTPGGARRGRASACASTGGRPSP